MDNPETKLNPTKFFEGARDTPLEVSHPEAEAYREKLIERNRRAIAWLDSMSVKNPVRRVGELVFARMQDAGHTRLGRMLRTPRSSEATRDIRSTPSQNRDKGWDRER